MEPPHINPLCVAGLVPAAGASRRLGRDKRRLAFRGRTVLETSVATLEGGGAAPVIVVLEPGSPCCGLAGVQRCLVVVNPAPARGMLSSIRCGLAHVPASASAVAILPGDQPFVPAAAVTALLTFYARERPLLLVPRYAGRRGHPLVLDRRLFDEAAVCDDGSGLRQLLERRAADLVVLDLDYPEAEQDIDVPEHLARLRE